MLGTFGLVQPDFFRALNEMIEPFVRAGIGSPVPTGLVVLEMRGRRSGRRLSIPLLATLIGGVAIVATVRPDSQWIRNLAADPEVHYWAFGRRWAATAIVVGRDVGTSETAAASPAVGCVASALRPWAHALGLSFAVLSTRRAGDAVA